MKKVLLGTLNDLRVLLDDLNRLIVEYSDYIELGHRYRKGDGLKQDHQEALRLYQLAASYGDSDAEAWVAYCLLRGEGGVIPNYKEGFRLSQLGVDKGNPFAYYNLGTCYRDGLGVKKDALKSVGFYRKGVELGNSYAQVGLGYCYRYGIGVEQDYKEALRLSRLAADQGNPTV